MFIPQADWSTPEADDPPPCFRQGDLVRVTWVWAQPSPVASNTHGGSSQRVQTELRDEIVALLSTCCDLVNHKAPKRKGVLISPLRSLPDNVRKRPELLEALKLPAAEALERKAKVPANLFYYAASSEHPEGVVYLETLAMIDFATLARGTKLAELTEAGRYELRERIKFHFTRKEP